MTSLTRKNIIVQQLNQDDFKDNKDCKVQLVATKSEFKFNKSALKLRKLALKDYNGGFLDLLSQLTEVGNVSYDDFKKQLEEMNKSNDTYVINIIEDTDRNVVIAAATLVIEKKFIHGCSKVGHIEDVVVNSKYRGAGLGFRVVDSLVKVGKDKGCYKVILDCNDKNISFYKKLGFKVKENHMVNYM